MAAPEMVSDVPAIVPAGTALPAAASCVEVNASARFGPLHFPTQSAPDPPRTEYVAVTERIVSTSTITAVSDIVPHSTGLTSESVAATSSARARYRPGVSPRSVSVLATRAALEAGPWIATAPAHSIGVFTITASAPVSYTHLT